MSTQGKNDYGNIFCESVDTIITQRLAGLKYDQTVLCSIVDDSKREKGIYRVTNGSIIFEAVSSETNYRNDNNVYVLIPEGNWNETKIITGKKNNKESEISYTYKNPFDYFVKISENKFPNTNQQFGLVANNPNVSEIKLGTFVGNEAGYTRLGIQAQFRSWLNPFYLENSEPKRVIKGSYGLRLDITIEGDKTVGEEGKGNKVYSLYLDASDMNGNPYDFNTFFQQEKVFDISNFEKIVSMSLYFYQEAKSFQDTEGNQIPFSGFLNQVVDNNLFVKDFYVGLGYDLRDFKNDDVVLYTLNNSTYNSTYSSDDNAKKVNLRWIHDFSGNKGLSVVGAKDLEPLGAEIRWYRYKFGAPSADKYSGVYWKDINPVEGNKFECSFEPDIMVAEEKIKAVVIYEGHSIASNIIVFTNEKEVVNQATIDAVSAVSINCEDGTYGNYHIYKLDNSLIDQKDNPKLRNFKVYFNISEKKNLESTEGKKVDSELTEAEKVEWIIPKKNSMIVLNNDYITANGGQDIGDDDNYHIVRNIAIDENSGEYQVGEANTQQYRIRGYYSQNYSNNTITCIITKDRIQYVGTKELTFGPAGTTGTDCTFVLDFDNGITALTIGNPVATTVTARLYDHENKEVDLSEYSIDWNILNSEEITYNVITSPYQIELQVANNPNMTSNYGILQAKLTNFGDFELIAYLPLPIRSDTNYKYISGTTSLVYNSSGYLDNFYWNPYILYYTQSTNSDILESYSNWSISTQNSDYGPKLDDYTDKDKNIKCYRLQPTSIYVDGGTNTGVCIYCTLNGTVVWSQPILITQIRYPAAILNQWNGELSLGGEDGNTIMSARVVAGSKDDQNRFSGVMMGDWSGKDATTDITNNTGIYGFYQGSASFGLRDNGTAFIGKSGTGRIEFDGEKSIIQSAVYQDGKGMSINLLAGTINAHEFELNVGGTRNNADTIFISTNPNNYPLQIGSKFYVKWDGTLKATNGEFSGTITGTSISASDISGGTISGGTISGGTISGTSISASNISGGTISGGTITGAIISAGSMNITGKGQDAGAFGVSENGVLTATGAIITGTITATSGSFTGTITAGEGDIGGWKIGTTTLTSKNKKIQLDASGEIIRAPYITVSELNGSSYSDLGTLGLFDYSNKPSSADITIQAVGIQSISHSVSLESAQGLYLDAGSSKEIYFRAYELDMTNASKIGLPLDFIFGDDTGTIMQSVSYTNTWDFHRNVKFVAGANVEVGGTMNVSGSITGNIYAKLK